jgi:tripartite-type tricarboxylate transporter receptor subunit TctC
MGVRTIGPKAIAIAVAAGFAAIAGATADEVKLTGGSVTLVVGYGPGGGYDAYARLAADHIGKFLPGTPVVVVDNMEGGGGRRSVVYLASAAPKDGTVITLVPSPIAFDSVQGQIPGNVNANDFGFIGRLTSTVDVEITWKTSATKTFEDAKNRETIVGSSGVTSNASFVPRIMNALFGAKFKIVEGYKSAADAVLAMQRGEVEGTVQTLQTMNVLHPEWTAEGDVNILWQQTMKRHPNYPDIPAIGEFATNDAQRQVLALAASTSAIGRSLAVPPGTPPAVLQMYRTAFQQMIKDPEFIADAKTRKLPLDPATGDDVAGYVRETMATPAPAIEMLRDALKVE